MPQQELRKLTMIAVYVFQCRGMFVVEELKGAGLGQHCLENIELVCES